MRLSLYSVGFGISNVLIIGDTSATQTIAEAPWSPIPKASYGLSNASVFGCLGGSWWQQRVDIQSRVFG